MAKKLSNSFSGGWSRQSGDALAELERRVEKSEIYTKLDVFTDEFSPPYTGELGPGQNPNKSSQPFEDKQALLAETTLPSALPRAAKTVAEKDQAMMDEIDIEQQKLNGGIKPATSQFPRGEDKFWRNERGLAKEIERRLNLRGKK